MLLHLGNAEQFNELSAKGRVLVDFFATWCGPCRQLAPELEDLENLDKDLTIVKVDVDQFNSLAAQFNIRAVPTLLYFNDGKLVNTVSGFLNANSLFRFVNQ